MVCIYTSLRGCRAGLLCTVFIAAGCFATKSKIRHLQVAVSLFQWICRTACALPVCNNVCELPEGDMRQMKYTQRFRSVEGVVQGAESHRATAQSQCMMNSAYFVQLSLLKLTSTGSVLVWQMVATNFF